MSRLGRETITECGWWLGCFCLHEEVALLAAGWLILGLGTGASYSCTTYLQAPTPYTHTPPDAVVLLGCEAWPSTAVYPRQRNKETNFPTRLYHYAAARFFPKSLLLIHNADHLHRLTNGDRSRGRIPEYQNRGRRKEKASQ